MSLLCRVAIQYSGDKQCVEELSDVINQFLHKLSRQVSQCSDEVGKLLTQITTHHSVEMRMILSHRVSS